MNSAEKRKQDRERRRINQLARDLDDAKARAAIAEGKVHDLEVALESARQDHLGAVARVKMAEGSNHELRHMVKDAEQRERDAREECSAKVTELNDAHGREIAVLDIEIAALRNKDKEPAKLRRRLQAGSQERERLQKQIGSLLAQLERAKGDGKAATL